MDAFRKAFSKVAGDENTYNYYNNYNNNNYSYSYTNNNNYSYNSSYSTSSSSPSAFSSASLSALPAMAAATAPPSLVFPSPVFPSSTPSVQYVRLPPPQPSLALATPVPRQLAFSYWGFSKLVTFCVVVGLVIGFRVKPRRVRRWVSKVLKKMTDDN